MLCKPCRADQFKFCEEVRNIAGSALSSFHHDEELQQWEYGAGEVDPVGATASAFLHIGLVAAAEA